MYNDRFTVIYLKDHKDVKIVAIGKKEELGMLENNPNIENTLIKHAFFVKNSNKRTSLLLSKLASDKPDSLSRIFHTKSIAIK